ncbi:MAG: hypothetical protein QXY40_11395 [Candidatus Methanomethylicia archaeon]
MRKPFLTIARVIIALNIVLALYLIIATITYPSTMLSKENIPQPPIKAPVTTLTINTTVIPTPAIAQVNKTLDRHVESTSTSMTDMLITSYGVDVYLPQIIVLILGLLLGVTSIALVFEFKASRSRRHLEGAFQMFKAAKIWYITGLISASTLLTYSILHRLNYGLIAYLMLIFESSVLVFFVWRILHIYRLRNKLLKLIGVEA